MANIQDEPDADLLVRGPDLRRGNEPLIEHAASLRAAAPEGTNAGDAVTFTVAYERPNVREGELRWSTLDRVTVTSKGEVTGAPAT